MIRVLARVMEAARTRWWNLYARARLSRAGASFGKSLRCQGLPIISLAAGSDITIGQNVVLCSDSRYTALGVAHPVILRTLRPGARIAIGDHCGFSGTSICAAVAVTIGDACLFGADVSVFDTDFHAIQPQGRRYNSNPGAIAAAPVRIGNNVFVGAGVRICKGVAIGDHSVIGAGSVVVRDIPANVVAAGNPARVVRRLDGPHAEGQR